MKGHVQEDEDGQTGAGQAVDRAHGGGHDRVHAALGEAGLAETRQADGQAQVLEQEEDVVHGPEDEQGRGRVVEQGQEEEGNDDGLQGILAREARCGQGGRDVDHGHDDGQGVDAPEQAVGLRKVGDHQAGLALQLGEPQDHVVRAGQEGDLQGHAEGRTDGQQRMVGVAFVKVVDAALALGPLGFLVDAGQLRGHDHLEFLFPGLGAHGQTSQGDEGHGADAGQDEDAQAVVVGELEAAEIDGPVDDLDGQDEYFIQKRHGVSLSGMVGREADLPGIPLADGLVVGFFQRHF